MFLLCSTICTTRPLILCPPQLPGPLTSRPECGQRPGTQQGLSDCLTPRLCLTSDKPFPNAITRLQRGHGSGHLPLSGIVLAIVQTTVLFIRFYLLCPTDTIVGGHAVPLGFYLFI